VKLGLPPDARIEPRDEDLAELRRRAELRAADDAGLEPGAEEADIEAAPESVDEGEMKERADRATRIAFANRPDVRTARDRIEDAQRHLVIAEDALRAEVTLGGTARVGEAASASMGAAGRDHADFKVRDATFGATLNVDLPFERSAEAVSYRNAIAAVEKAVRAWQELEDSLKRTVREDVRAIALTEERLRIQFRAVDLAARRVRNQDLLLEAGRAEMTDLLDAQAALVTAQNALYAAITESRENELRLQCDLGILDATVDGTWREADLDGLGLAH
jgi:outer membrane protein TolC